MGLAVVWVLLIGLTLSPEVDDFRQLRRGAVDLVQQGDPYATRGSNGDAAANSPDDVDASGERGFKYAPVFAYLFQPFALLSQRQGQLLWFGINIVALAALIALCVRLSGSTLARRYWGVVALATVVAPPTRLSLQLGQISILLALLLVGVFALDRRRAPLTGLLLALAGLVKLYPALMGVFYLLRGPRRVAIWSLTSVVALVAVFIPFYGVEHYRRFAEVVVLSGNHPYTAEFNLSLMAFWNRLLAPSSYAVPVLDAPGVARLLVVASSLAVLAVCLVVRRHDDEPLSRMFEYSMWLCAMLLLSPINGSYNLVQLLFPILALLRYLELHRDNHMRNWLIVATALACWPPAWTDWQPALYNGLHIGLGVLLLAPAFYGLVLYLWLLARQLRRPSEKAAAREASSTAAGV
jgi:hypothetical protein